MKKSSTPGLECTGGQDVPSAVYQTPPAPIDYFTGYVTIE